MYCAGKYIEQKSYLLLDWNVHGIDTYVVFLIYLLHTTSLLMSPFKQWIVTVTFVVTLDGN